MGEDLRGQLRGGEPEGDGLGRGFAEGSCDGEAEGETRQRRLGSEPCETELSRMLCVTGFVTVFDSASPTVNVWTRLTTPGANVWTRMTLKPNVRVVDRVFAGVRVNSVATVSGWAPEKDLVLRLVRTNPNVAPWVWRLVADFDTENPNASGWERLRPPGLTAETVKEMVSPCATAFAAALVIVNPKERAWLEILVAVLVDADPNVMGCVPLNDLPRRLENAKPNARGEDSE